MPPITNPWNAGRATGGSSSGAGVAIASGACVLALGSDTGGSVRIPAHCCGITALKPTHGRLPLDGTMTLSPTLDTIGPMARTARELYQAWPALARDPVQVAPIRHVSIAADLMDLTDPAIVQGVHELVRVLEGLGITVAECNLRPIMTASDAPFGTILQFEAFRAHHRLLSDASPVSPMTRRRLERSSRVTRQDYATALAKADTLRTRFAGEILSGCDAILLPVAPILAPPRELTDPGSPLFDPRTLYALGSFTLLSNLFGTPALALPCGFDPGAGIPMAAQLMTSWGREVALLELGCQIQSVTDWHGHVPLGRDPSVSGADGDTDDEVRS
ncbi:MAG: amidase [Hyphomicrobiaceae bacterium]